MTQRFKEKSGTALFLMHTTSNKLALQLLKGNALMFGQAGKNELRKTPLGLFAHKLLRSLLQLNVRGCKEANLEAADMIATLHAHLLNYSDLFIVTLSRSLNSPKQDRAELTWAIIDNYQFIGARGANEILKQGRCQPFR